MKILYAVQATGNGHISRAHQLFPYLNELGEVDIMLSGSNATLAIDLPIKYRSKGLSLFYSQCGGLDYLRTWREVNIGKVLKDAKELPVDKYDLIINDFDFVTARACKLKNKNSIQFGHQASFMSQKTPRPTKRNIFGEFILSHYARATDYVGLHFDRYDEFIFPPIVKKEIIDAQPKNHGHITVYLPAYQQDCISKILKSIAPIEVHWFLPEVVVPYKTDNIHYFPVNQKYFNESLIYCLGLLTGGGFETPAEALYLNKKLMTIPIEGQYEQQCNAEALARYGVSKIAELNDKTKNIFLNWIYENKPLKAIEANDIPSTIQYLLSRSN